MNEDATVKRVRLASELASLEEDLDAAEEVHWGIMKAIEKKHAQINLLEGGAA